MLAYHDRKKYSFNWNTLKIVLKSVQVLKVFSRFREEEEKNVHLSRNSIASDSSYLASIKHGTDVEKLSHFVKSV
jgi:hypothetical protein